MATTSVKMIREHLCTAQHFDGGAALSAVHQALIDLCDVLRPLGPDGKHGDRHTALCGCDDAAMRTDGSDRRAWMGEVVPAKGRYPAAALIDVLPDLSPFRISMLRYEVERLGRVVSKVSAERDRLADEVSLARGCLLAQAGPAADGADSLYDLAAAVTARVRDLRRERDEARAAVERARVLFRQVESLPTAYTHAPGENSARLVDLLSADCYRIGAEGRAALDGLDGARGDGSSS